MAASILSFGAGPFNRKGVYPMTTSKEVSSQISQATQMARQAVNTNSSQGYRNLATAFQKLDMLAREAFQAKLKGRYRPILSKLEGGLALDAEDVETIKLLIVGEADSYLQSENDLSSWQQEIDRLLSQAQQLEKDNLEDMETLLKLRAICQEAMRAVPDLVYYYEQLAVCRREKVYI
jgi:hypothetical protein